MRRVIFILPLVFLFVVQAAAEKEKVYHRENTCTIGCGKTKKHRRETEDKIITIIKCSGFGFKGCPGGIVTNPTPPKISEFEANAINDRVALANEEMDDGNLNGSDGKVFYNTETGQSWVYTVEWNREVDDEGELVNQNVDVYREKVKLGD